ncbi:hypothetical protein, partial [Thermobrachium celere]|uniref:hypothetical protein n=1 Tax=Thermobrachium celere TaxID=53422 RepID=UPI0031012221
MIRVKKKNILGLIFLFFIILGELKVYASGAVSNSYLEFVVSPTGRFTIGTTGGNPSNSLDDYQNMLFGHPIPSTSFTTIKIDGIEYIYSPNYESPINNLPDLSNTSSNYYGDILVKQTLKIVKNSNTGNFDTVEIKYSIKNCDTKYHNVGVRIMLDTMLGYNDSAPFRLPNIGPVTTETELTGNNIPEYWQAFDDLQNPSVIAQGTLINNVQNKPDKIQFVNWSRIYNTMWNYSISPGSPNGDSAVGIYWNEKPLAPGETKEYITYYGLSEFFQDLRPPLSFSVTGANIIQLTPEGYSPNPVTITAYISNIGNGNSNNVKATINLPEGISLVEGQQNIIYLGTIAPGELRQISWQIKIPNCDVDKTINYSISLEGDEQETKTITRSIFIPQFKILSESIAINPNSLTLKPGETRQLSVIKKLVDGSTVDVTSNDKGTIYTTNRSDILTVNQDGMIFVSSTAKDGDTATVTALNNGKYASCEIVIKEDTTEKLEIIPNTLNLGPGQKYQLSVVHTLIDGSTKDVTRESGIIYTTNSTSVATVNGNGEVTVSPSASVGFKATITAKYGGKTATCVVTVANATTTISSLRIEPSSVSKAPGETEQLKVIATMSDGSTKEVTRESGIIYTTNSTSVA